MNLESYMSNITNKVESRTLVVESRKSFIEEINVVVEGVNVKAGFHKVVWVVSVVSNFCSNFEDWCDSKNLYDF